MLTEFGLKIAPSTYYAALTRPVSARAVRDEELMKLIEKIYRDNYSVYGARKVWWQLRRDGVEVRRCRVERLMRRLGLVGAVRGKPVRTTVADKDHERAADLVKRQFAAGAPNRLWVADFTHVATWGGTAYVAFAIDVFSRRIVGWRARMSKETNVERRRVSSTVYRVRTITTTRAKYLLARLEREQVLSATTQADAMPDWSSKSVSVEHIFPKSLKRGKFESDEQFGEFLGMKEKPQNLTLLERTLNNGLEDKPFPSKVETYRKSAFRTWSSAPSR